MTISEAKRIARVAPTRKTGGSLRGYNPLKPGQRLKTLAFALLYPPCPYLFILFFYKNIAYLITPGNADNCFFGYCWTNGGVKSYAQN